MNVRYIISDRYYLKSNWVRRFGFGVSEITCPEKAADFLLAAGLRGNIFNNDGIGGYLIWRLFPQSKVFVDGRMQVYGPAFLEYYDTVFTHSWLWDECVKKYKIDYVVLEYAHSHLEYTQSLSATEKLISHLYQHPEWELIYFDEQVIVFVRDIPQHKEIIAKYKIDIQTISLPPQEDRGHGAGFKGIVASLLQRQRFPFAEYALGNLFATLGRTDLAEAYFQKALAIHPHHPSILYEVSRIDEPKGLADKPIEEYKKALELKPDDAFLHYGLVSRQFSSVG